MKTISYYYQNGFFNLDYEEEMEIVQYIQENGIETSTLYRGLQIDEIPEEGDEFFLNGEHEFCSMSPNVQHASYFGNVILVINGLKGIKVEESDNINEWLVEDQKVYVTDVKEENGITFVYCE